MKKKIMAAALLILASGLLHYLCPAIYFRAHGIWLQASYFAERLAMEGCWAAYFIVVLLPYVLFCYGISVMGICLYHIIMGKGKT